MYEVHVYVDSKYSGGPEFDLGGLDFVNGGGGV